MKAFNAIGGAGGAKEEAKAAAPSKPNMGGLFSQINSLGEAGASLKHVEKADRKNAPPPGKAAGASAPQPSFQTK